MQVGGEVWVLSPRHGWGLGSPGVTAQMSWVLSAVRPCLGGVKPASELALLAAYAGPVAEAAGDT